VPVEQIKSAVVDGQRPDLLQIEGPEHFVAFARPCIKKCWNGVPEQRPAFAGKLLTSVCSAH